MPGFLLHFGASVICSHGGQAQPVSTNPRVMVSGQPVVMQPIAYTVAGCPFTNGSSPQPCLTAQWITAAIRVTSMGIPLLLFDSQSVCVPNPSPLVIITTQTRVSGV